MSKEQLESGKGSAVSLELPATGSAEVNHTQEAIAALMVLGYAQSEALQAMKGLDLSEYPDAESIIRVCLKRLAMG